MSHERDRDHHVTPQPPPPIEPRDSKSCPDRPKSERPSVVPREPVDPRCHPRRRLVLRARPA